ncbi:DNA primase [uncultured Caudovirales phage]|uniref:DNA primase n=1 Tax=uncultured Caudovirales phage TaxID=2100421 RepID=A0A6J7WKA4_9CAUD|nr:DNA primase [uncultured Caudovirales phage]
MLNSIRDAVTQILPHKRKTNSTSGWISFNGVCCPHNGESPDTRGRGGLVMNPDGGISYHCFNCSYKASYVPGRHLTYKFRKLLSWLGANEGTIKRLVIDAIRIKDLVAPEQIVETVEQEEIKFKARPLPEEARTLTALASAYILSNSNMPEEYVDSVNYVTSRSIDTNKYPFYWTPETQYNLHRRVIVPFTWRNEIIGYTARAVTDEVKPKYHNSHEPNYVFNVDRQLPTSKFVIVCEGPFDAMSIDGVAILGNHCHEQQADIIDSLTREVIVVPDTDRAGRNLVKQAIEYGWSVSFPEWMGKHKDINSAVIEYGKLFVLKSILSAKQSNRLKIELHAKKLYN